jgi:nucleotide-binding universal stress UspA family protein
MKTIVVGVDGSPASKVAVEFATREAAVHGVALRLVTAWEMPTSVLSGGGVPTELYKSFEAAARTTVDEAAALAKTVEPSVVVETRVVEGHAGNALVEESADAGLVAIGRRGHSGFAEFLLGSISHQVADHAKCPVVIVPPKPAGV